MLTSLNIRNLALVEKQELSFSAGFNVVTGETGAGKSVILGAIRLLLGGRADKTFIRSGEKSAELSAVFELADCPSALKHCDKVLEEAGIEAEESRQLILRRVISHSGTRNYVNSVPTPLKTLKDLGESFIELYAPGEHQSLCDTARQLELLDRYAGLHEQVQTVKSLYRDWQSLIRQEADYYKDLPDGGECEILRYQVDEIKKASLKADEDIEVNREYKEAAGNREAYDLAYQSFMALGDENGLKRPLQDVVRSLMQMERLDDECSEYTEALSNIMDQISELSSDLQAYTHRLNLDPQHLSFLEERLSIIQQMKKKYGPELSHVFAYCERAQAKLDKADHFEKNLAEIKEKIIAAEKAYLKEAKALSKNRQKAAPALAESIAEELKQLDFMQSIFAIDFAEQEASSVGIDAVEFQFAPNKGEGIKALREVASSGEISRIMLAVKSVLASVDKVPVLIFDEIDANVGGLVATKVARKLHQLGENHQVFCITHTPQVAAGGHAHYRVEKSTVDGRTYTEMVTLSSEDKVLELSRMLGGEKVSSVVEDHAKELIASARS